MTNREKLIETNIYDLLCNMNKAITGFQCDKCGCIWVYHEPMCIVCGTLGTALNKRAERILRKTQRSEEE